MHSDISKKDHEHSNHFRVIMVLYNPYNREKEYKGLNRTVTHAIYLRTIYNFYIKQCRTLLTTKIGQQTSKIHNCSYTSPYDICKNEKASKNTITFVQIIYSKSFIKIAKNRLYIKLSGFLSLKNSHIRTTISLSIQGL